MTGDSRGQGEHEAISLSWYADGYGSMSESAILQCNGHKRHTFACLVV